ncbi:MAG: hypothetical protein J5I99_04375 [Verrucomicrobia bacterium]|nr:hypothetical protein [Verrucomicrobiota bacterium]
MSMIRICGLVVLIFMFGCNPDAREVKTDADLKKLLAVAETNSIVHFVEHEEGDGGTLSLYRISGGKSLYKREDFTIRKEALTPETRKLIQEMEHHFQGYEGESGASPSQ